MSSVGELKLERVTQLVVMGFVGKVGNSEMPE